MYKKLLENEGEANTKITDRHMNLKPTERSVFQNWTHHTLLSCFSHIFGQKTNKIITWKAQGVPQ